MIAKYLIAIALLSMPILDAAADGSTGHASAASEHSMRAAAHLSAAGVKTVSAMSAVPLLVIGEVGALSAAAGNRLLEFSGEPLPIDDAVLTTLPSPAQVLQGESQ